MFSEQRIGPRDDIPDRFGRRPSFAFYVLMAGVLSFRRTLPGLSGVDLRQVDSTFLEALATEVIERQRWLLTVVDDHVYVDLGARALDGEIVRVPLPSEEEMRPR